MYCYFRFVLLLLTKTIETEYKSFVLGIKINNIKFSSQILSSSLFIFSNTLFLLHTIFERSQIATSSRLNEITFSFFNYSLMKPKEFWLKHHGIEAKHLLDLIRKIFMPENEKQESDSMLENGKQSQIPCLKKENKNHIFLAALS